MINKQHPNKYFPTNQLKKMFNERKYTNHCWNTFNQRLIALEKQGLIESLETTTGTMWRIKNG